MYQDEFYIQHSILSVPETLVDLVELARQLLKTFETSLIHININDSDSFTLELSSEIYRTLDEAKRQIMDVLNELIELESDFCAKLSSIAESVVRELEPAVLNLKRQLTNGLKSVKEISVSVADVSNLVLPMEARVLKLKDIFDTSSAQSGLGNILYNLLSDIRSCWLLMHVISIREHMAEPIAVWETADTPLETNTEQDALTSARLAVTRLKQENLELASINLNPPSMIVPWDEDSLIDKTLKLLNNLQYGFEFLSLRQGAWLVADLAFLLFKIQAYDEAIAMSNWALKLFDKLDEDTFTPYRVLARPNHANYAFRDANYSWDGFRAMSDCLELNRGYCESASSLFEFRHQLGRSLTICAAMEFVLRSPKLSEHDSEAVEVFEAMIKEIQPEDIVGRPTDVVEENANSSLHGPIARRIIHPRVIYDYVHALYQRALCLKQVPNWDLILQLIKTAEEQTSKLPASQCLALPSCIFAQLSHSELDISQEDRLVYQEKTANIDRLRFQVSKRCVFAFYANLRTYATSLESQGQHDAALAALQELVGLATGSMMSADFPAHAHGDVARIYSELDRYEEAFRHRDLSIQFYRRHVRKAFSDYEATELIDGVDLFHKAGRLQEAIAMGLQATHQCRMADTGDGLYRLHLAESLALTARSFSTIGDHESALSQARQSLDVFETLDATADEHSVHTAVFCMDVLLDVAYYSFEPISLEYSKECLGRLRELHETHPDEAAVQHSAGCHTHALKLYMHNQYEEAVQWTESMLPWFEAQNLGPDSPKVTANYIQLLYNLGHDYSALANTTMSLEYYQKAREASVRYSSPPTQLQFGYASKLLDLGRLEEGLAVAKDTLDYARSHTDSGEVDDLPRALSAYVTALSMNGLYEEAVIAAREAVREADSLDLRNLHVGSAIPLDIATSYRRLADTLIDVGEPSEALVYARKASAIMGDVKAGTKYHVAWSFSEGRYRLTYLTLGICLMCNGEFEEALRLFEGEATAPPENRPVFLKSYVLVMQLCGWCLCALGRHEEAVGRYERVGRLLGGLEAEVLVVIERFLKRERRTPGHIALWKSLGLDCGHYVQ